MFKVCLFIAAATVAAPLANADQQSAPTPTLAESGDARKVVVTDTGLVVTDQLADTPMTFGDMSRLSGHAALESLVMRSTDGLAHEPLVARMGVDQGGLFRTDPIPVARFLDVPVIETPQSESD